MIKFRCNNCGSKLSVPQIHAGKKGNCPKCKNVILVPQLESESTGPISEQGASGDSGIAPKYSDYDLSLLDVPRKSESQDGQAGQYDMPAKDIEQLQKPEQEKEVIKIEPVDERKLPWFVDIFLYPTSKEGLSAILLILLLRILIDVATMFCCIGEILGFVAKIFMIYLYMYWYFSECVRGSAAGCVRAPEIIGNYPKLEEMGRQCIRLVVCYAFTLGPATFYRGYTHFHEIEMSAVVFWSLLTCGIIFFPMVTLAVVMFNSADGMNPVLLIRSISRTFLQYCGLVLMFYCLAMIFYVLRNILGPMLKQSEEVFIHWLSYLFFSVAFIYLLFIAGYILGRFYWRYKDKLNWDV
ncbi:MAG: hypothetical protein PVH77_00490 [Phycisphaerales bacterium]|jgi:hypothetical protein